MKIAVIIACGFSLTACSKSRDPKSSNLQQPAVSITTAAGSLALVQTPQPQGVSEWKPISKGAPYQLALGNGVFGFCDATGPQQIDLTTGRQTAGNSRCDPNKDAIKKGCGDQIDIVSSSASPHDTVSVERYSFRLHGHVRDCDRDGSLVIVSTTGEVALMDGATNRIMFVKADLPDTVVIGSGWAAWNSEDKKVPLRLEKTATSMQQAIIQHEK